MRYHPIQNQLFKSNRQEYLEKVRDNSISIFHSNDLMPKNADQHMPFKQNSDLFYLTGIDQEETTLMIVKKENQSFVYLFIKETSEQIKIWEGEKLSKKQAGEISGIQNIEWNGSFEQLLVSESKKCSIFYLNSNDHPRANIVVESRDERFKKWLTNRFPNKIYKKASEILYPIRAVKKN